MITSVYDERYMLRLLLAGFFFSHFLIIAVDIYLRWVKFQWWRPRGRRNEFFFQVKKKKKACEWVVYYRKEATRRPRDQVDLVILNFIKILTLKVAGKEARKRGKFFDLLESPSLSTKVIEKKKKMGDSAAAERREENCNFVEIAWLRHGLPWPHVLLSIFHYW